MALPHNRSPLRLRPVPHPGGNFLGRHCLGIPRRPPCPLCAPPFFHRRPTLVLSCFQPQHLPTTQPHLPPRPLSPPSVPFPPDLISSHVCRCLPQDQQARTLLLRRSVTHSTHACRSSGRGQEGGRALLARSSSGLLCPAEGSIGRALCAPLGVRSVADIALFFSRLLAAVFVMGGECFRSIYSVDGRGLKSREASSLDPPFLRLTPPLRPVLILLRYSHPLRI